MSAFKDLTGNVYNKWTVIKRGKTLVRGKQRRTYWVCQCVCGNIVEVYANSLTSGKSKGCYCGKGKSEGESAKRTAYNLYRVGARDRNKDFNLTLEQFVEFSQKECFYCGSPPSNRAGTEANNGYYKYNGLDRVDNNKGYSLDNIVSCCKNCNMAKRQLTQEEFFAMIKKIYERHFNEKS